MSEGHKLMALILGYLKLISIVSLAVGIILGALLENQLSKNFRGLGFDDEIHSIVVLLITTGLFCGWTIVSIIGAMACRPRWTWVTGVLDMLFISIIAVNLPLLIALTSFTCDPDLGNGVCDFSTVMAGAYFTAIIVTILSGVIAIVTSLWPFKFEGETEDRHLIWSRCVNGWVTSIRGAMSWRPSTPRCFWRWTEPGRERLDSITLEERNLGR